MKSYKLFLSIIVVTLLSACSARSLLPNNSGDPIIYQENRNYMITAIYPESMEIDLTDVVSGKVYSREKLKLCGSFNSLRINQQFKLQEDTYSKYNGSQYTKLNNVRNRICGNGIESVFDQ